MSCFNSDHPNQTKTKYRRAKHLAHPTTYGTLSSKVIEIVLCCGHAVVRRSRPSGKEYRDGKWCYS